MHPFGRSSLLSLTAFTALVVLATSEASADSPTGSGGSPTLARGAESGGSIASVASADPSTGVVRTSIPFAFPRARGLAQPELSLDYAAGATRGEGGFGWSLSVPRIERRGVSGGMPTYRDGDWANPLSDRFYYNGARLTPIGVVQNGACAAGLPGEIFPTWAEGMTYFRPTVGDGSLRFFYAASHETWVVQMKSGVTSYFGKTQIPPSTTGATGDGYERYVPPAVLTNGTANTQASRWFISLSVDPWNNEVAYRYRHIVSRTGERVFLTDIYDTPPPGRPSVPFTEWAHHAHLRWSNVYPTAQFENEVEDGILTDRGIPNRLLLGVDVGSKTFTGTGARALVRRYHLRYSVDPNAPVSSGNSKGELVGASIAVPFLKGSVLEGGCNGITESPSDETFPDATPCLKMPETQYTYSGENAAPIALGALHSPGVGTFVDLTGDGLPDFLSPDGTLSDTTDRVGNVAVTTWETRPNAAGRTAQFKDLFGISNDSGTITGSVLGDFTGDGQPNFLVWKGTNTGPGNGTYEVYSLTPGSTSLAKTWTGKGPFQVPQGSLLAAVAQGAPRTVDLDGDGYTDLSLVEYTKNHYNASLTTRDARGVITPFARTTEVGGACGVDDASFVDSAFGDVDGDGLPEFVGFRMDPAAGGSTFQFIHALVYRNLDNGRFGLWKEDSTGACTDDGAIDDFKFASANGIPHERSLYGIHDVTGDGRGDIIRVSSTGLDVFAQKWNGFEKVYHAEPADLWQDNSYDRTKLSLQFADVNRSGVDDVVVVTGYLDKTLPSYSGFRVSRSFDIAGGVRPGLLTGITRDGATTTIAYKTIDGYEPTKAGDWQSAVPQVLSVVQSITTTNGLTGPQAQTSTTSYAYESPVYDVRERIFEGFRFATVTTQADARAPGVIVRTEFATRTPSGVGPGTPYPLTTNYTWPMTRGLPVVTETSERLTTGPGVRLTTQTQSYEAIKGYDGLDGALTMMIRRKRADTYVFDRAQQATTTTRVNVVSVSSTNPTDILALSQDIAAVTIPSKGGKHLRVESTVDAFGNLTTDTDFGEDGVDDPIQSRTVWKEPEIAGEAWHGYLYRPTSYETSYTTKDGKTATGPVRAASYAWGTRGELSTTSATLSGTIALDRSPLRGVPPLPADASAQANHAVVLEHAYYDNQGNVVWSVTPNSRCTKLDYDSEFAELMVGTTRFDQGCSGDPTVSPPNGGRVTGRVFDRGLQLVTAVYSPSGRLTAMTYDDFGRVKEVYAPSAFSLYQVTPQPTQIIEYRDTSIGGPAFVHTKVADGANENDVSYHETWDYFDPWGHAVVHLSEGGTKGWIASGYNERSSNGRVVRVFEPFDTSGPTGASFVFATPTAKSSMASYDALGRVVSGTDLEGHVVSSNVYRPFEVDHYDGEQLAAQTDASGKQVGGKHVGAYTTSRVDGHGRTVATIKYVKKPTPDTITTTATYLATGEMTSRTESHAGGSVLRWMQYDSFGRMVLNVHPDTSVNFTSSVGTVGSDPPAGLKAWRYAYDDAGDLVGTSDPRGCGRNLTYDRLGRVVSEDYWPCTADQPAYTPPNLATGDGTEHFVRYDTAEPGHDAGASLGKVTSVSDRARRTFFSYDARGRVQNVQRQIARANGAASTLAVLATRYSPHLFAKTFDYDDANRVVNESTGADVDELMVNGQSVLTSAYSRRGTLDSISGSYGTLIDQLDYYTDGSLKTQRLGDVSHTTSAFTYDAEHRLRTVSIQQKPTPSPIKGGGGCTGIWCPPTPEMLMGRASIAAVTSGPTTIPDLTEETIDYDLVGNPTTIADATDPTPWKDGAKPVASRSFTYDDSYRLASASYTYGATGDDLFVSPYDAEVKAGSSRFPKLSSSAKGRVRSQTFEHDWLGNLSTSGDNENLVGERSLGVVISGGAAGGPHRFASAANGQLDATYDAAGNLTRWRQQKCTVVGSSTCPSVTYSYTWDEANRLATAQRDEGTPATTATLARIEYAYAATGERVLAHKVDSDESGYDVDVFPSLRLQGASYTGSPGQAGVYDASPATERVYLATGGVSLGVVAFAQTDFDTSGKRRLFFEVGDHLGSTSFVIDQETSELVERPTYQAYGAAESDFRPDRWKNFRETFRFNGKIDDAEVGLAYYGARYLIPTLGRWASPDPLEIQALGSDPNPYAFANGAPTSNVDSTGLDSDCDKCGSWSFDVGSFVGGGSSGGGNGSGAQKPAGPPGTETGSNPRGATPGAAPPPPPPQVVVPSPAAPVPAPVPNAAPAPTSNTPSFWQKALDAAVDTAASWAATGVAKLVAAASAAKADPITAWQDYQLGTAAAAANTAIGLAKMGATAYVLQQTLDPSAALMAYRAMSQVPEVPSPASAAGDVGYAAGIVGTFFIPGIGEDEAIALGAEKLLAAAERVGEAESILARASDAAFQAAERIGEFTVPAKHLPGAGGNWSRFAAGENPQALIEEALRSPDAHFLPNNRPGSFRVVYDFGRAIGESGETSIRVIIGEGPVNGRVWTAFPN